MKTMRSAQVETTLCFHCGDTCQQEHIIADDHDFCCNGCKLVYELLKDNSLCDYYSISSHPGIKRKAARRNELYATLDEPAIRQKLIRFENGDRSRVVFHIPEMHCTSCIFLLEQLHRIEPAILASEVHFLRREVTVDFNTTTIRLSEIASLLNDIGYSPSISLGDLEIKKKQRKFNPRVLKIGIAGFCFGNIMMMSFPDYLSFGDLAETPQLKGFFSWISLFLSLPVLFYSASDFFISAWKTIRYRRLNIDAPIALAIAVTFGRSVYEIVWGGGAGYLDSMSGIVFFMLLGRFFQDRTYEDLSFERDYRAYFPIAVSALREGKEIPTSVNELKKGDHILIRGGELIPADCILRSDRASIDYSFVSGESASITKVNGDKIFAGAKQISGTIELEVVQKTSQSYLTQLWNNDAFSKSRETKDKTYIDRINQWFTSGVLLVAFGSAAVWFFIDKNSALNSLTAVLIVACPCTLLLASTFTNGNVMRWLGRNKFYLKNPAIIERLSNSDTIVFDKTGTMTCAGDSNVIFEGDPLTEMEKRIIRSLASQSGHPISRQIANWLHDQQLVEVRAVKEIPGKGISASIGGRDVLLGSAEFTEAGKMIQSATEAWLAIDHKIRGRFILRNSYRTGMKEVLTKLKRTRSIYLLSGDNDSERDFLQPFFGKNMLFFSSPEGKLQFIRSLQEQGKKVIMIGDGLNDAGALMQADAGIALSDNMNNYFPACDAILSGDQFGKLPDLLSFTTVARHVVTISFIVSVLYNLVGVTIAVQGHMSPLIAAILMPASSFSVILLTTLAVSLAAIRSGVRSPKNRL